MKSLMSLWQEMALEMAIRCHTSATMDIKTVRGRYEHEGLSFLTITLPDVGKATEKWLDQGWVDPSYLTSFSFDRGLPRFLGGFLDRVFDRGSGVLLDDPCVDSILAIRQLTLMFGKISIPCSDARERKAMRGFIECEQDVRANDARLSNQDLVNFKRMSMMLFGSIFQEVDRQVYHMEIVPKHGPGVTADKLLGNQKYRQSTWTARLESILPMGEMILPSWSYYDHLDEVDVLEPGSEIPVKVISVPKTLKTPRIIAIEPTAMQYSQQALQAAIRDAITKVDYLDRIIGFDDQVPNQHLACEGSSTGDLATLDLSEASDRVSNQLVREMTSNYRHLNMAIDACRSRKADVPGHGVIRLAKFASMGSALTFPIEAMVFTTLIFLGIEAELNTTLSQKDVKHLSDRVRVYGDDIIVPVDYVSGVVRMLQHFGAVVNTGKSFWTGKFRESCGKEYYDGQDVSIVRVRHLFPTHRQDATRVISLVSLRNQLYYSGCWQTVRYLDGKIGKVLKHFPTVFPTSRVLGRHSFIGYQTDRMDDGLHSPLVRGYVVKSRIPKNSLEGPGALLKFFLKRGGLPSVDRNHLERSGRPLAVDIKLGWFSPF